jgi:hypothetical protein
MINGTIIVQAINFFIGYLIFKYIFLKPGLEVVQKQIKQEEVLNYSIVSLRRQIADCRIEQEHKWRETSKRLCSKKPCIEETVVVDYEVFVESPLTIDREQERTLIEQVKEIIFAQASRE